jgi:hypothetical protein
LSNIGEEHLPAGSRFLPKPYSARQIVGAVRDLVAVSR